jgi:DNA-binding MarR family transcriptional regulator
MNKINENELALQLKTAISRLVKVIRHEVRHDEILSLTERSTLFLISQQASMLPSELATKEKVTNQSMSQIINKLCHIGYVIKTPSIEDKRKVIVTVTSKGKEFIEFKKNKKTEWLAKTISKKTTAAEKAILTDAITILTKLVD